MIVKSKNIYLKLSERTTYKNINIKEYKLKMKMFFKGFGFLQYLWIKNTISDILDAENYWNAGKYWFCLNYYIFINRWKLKYYGEYKLILNVHV